MCGFEGNEMEKDCILCKCYHDVDCLLFRVWLQSHLCFVSLRTVSCLGVLTGAQLFSLNKEELRAVIPEEGARVYSQLTVQKSLLEVNYFFLSPHCMLLENNTFDSFIFICSNLFSFSAGCQEGHRVGGSHGETENEGWSETREQHIVRSRCLHHEKCLMRGLCSSSSAAT